MSKILTTNALVADVKRRAMIPESQATFQESDFLAFANEEMDIGIIPHVLSYHEEYFVHTELIEILPNVTAYEIPARAVGNKLRNIAYQDGQGSVFEMARIQLEDLPRYQANFLTGSPTLFYVRGSEIVLVPEVSNTPTGSLRFTYYVRPNEMVSEDRVGIITGIDRTTGIISVDAIPSVISLDTPLDLVQTKSPHKTISFDLSAASINSGAKTIQFDPADIPSKLAIGDQVALAGECIVPQVPTELHSMLAQRVAARCLEALGDVQGLGSANTKLAEMEAKTGSLLDNRVEGTPQKIINRHTALKKQRYLWRFRS